MLLGIDLGTSGVKALVISEEGKVLAKAFEEYSLYTPRPGWAEQDPEEWWDAVLKVIKNVLNSPGIEPKKIEGLALSGQMHGAVFLDKDNKVIRPAILWCDTRTSKQCKEITEKAGEERLFSLVSNAAFEGFTAPKILWLKENEQENYKRVKTLLLPKDYIVYKLTGILATEVSDAAGTLLFDVRNRKWSGELLDILEINESILPPVLNSIDIVGKVSAEASKLTGLSSETKIIAGGADNACSAVGNGIIEEELISSSIGSSGVIFAHTDTFKQDYKGRVHTFNHAVPNKWYLMGVMLTAGLSLKWFRDNFGQLERGIEYLSGIDSYELLDKEAASIAPGSDGLIFLPYLNGERTPHRNARARGVFFGLSLRHKKGHFVRSIMEGVTFGLRDSLEIIKELGISPRQIRLTGGGAKSNLWCQIQADIFNSEVAIMEIDEGPAFGAALLAGVGSGVYANIETAAAKTVRVVQRIKPIPENVVIYEKLYPIFNSLYIALRNEYDKAFDIATSIWTL